MQSALANNTFTLDTAKAIGTPLLLAIALLASIYLLPMAADAVLGLALLYVAATGGELKKQCHVLLDDALGKLTLLLVIYLCLSVLWSSQWELQDLAQTWMRALLCLCVLITLANTSPQSAAAHTFMSRAIAVSVVLSALVCIALWLQNPPDDGRLNGLFRLNNPGKAGRSYAAALPFLLFAFLVHSGRWLATLGILLATAAVILTDTRAAWLGAFAGAATVLLSTWHGNRKRFLRLGILTIAVCAAVLAGFALHPDPEVRALLLPRGDSFRLQIWSDHWHYILEEVAIFGGGYLASLEIDLGNTTTTGAHNMYLSVALQIGLPGLALFLTIIGGTALRLYRNLELPVARMALGLLACSLVVYVFNGDRLLDKVNFIWLATWLPIAIALSLHKPPAQSA